MESLADDIGNAIGHVDDVLTIVNGFPFWSSPLYAPVVGDDGCLQRSRFYLPEQQGGFEVGIQENDYHRFTLRLAKQRENWNLPPGDKRIGTSDLPLIVSGGLPIVCGFALSPDRITRIWRSDCVNDPYASPRSPQQRK